VGAALMTGNVFLGSIFKGLGPLRDNIWREIQKTNSLNCISLQLDHLHVADYPRSLLRDIRRAINRSDFFIILVGPSYGTEISKTRVKKDKTRNNWDVSFSQYELERAVLRLKSISNNRSNRILLVELKSGKGGVSSKLKRYREYADRLNIGFLDYTVTKKNGNYHISRRKSDWKIALDNFLLTAKRVSSSEQRRKYLAKFKIKSNTHVHVAGWSGIENRELYTPLLKFDRYHTDSFSFLIMDRSLIEFPKSTNYSPRLGHDNLPFDFLFSDIEIVPFHKTREYIQKFSNEPNDAGSYVKNCFADETPFFSSLIGKRLDQLPCIQDETVYAVPLLYGFNEIIVKNSESAAKQEWSYSDFDLPALVKAGHKVGLWGWWVATFPIVLLAHAVAIFEKNPNHPFKTLKENHTERVAAFADWMTTGAKTPVPFEEDIQWLVTSIISKVRRIRKSAREDKIHVYRTLEVLKRALEKEELDVVLGGTSGVLATCNSAARNTYSCKRPEEGLYLWVNCVCRTPHPDKKLLGMMVRHWLSEKTQIELSIGSNPEAEINSKSYVGVPVNKKAADTFRKKAIDLPSLNEIQRTLDDFEKAKHSDTHYAFRPFPHQVAFLLEYHWNCLVQRIGANYHPKELEN
jgi:hypothetical protein